MSAFTDRVSCRGPWCAGLATTVLCILIASGSPTHASAQRLELSRDSLERLTAGLAPESRDAAEVYYLASSDSVARDAIREFRLDPNADGLILAILEHDRSAEVRRALMSVIDFYADQFADIPGIVPALVDRVAQETSVDNVAAAIAAVRAVSFKANGLHAAMIDRLAAADAAGDTAMLRLLLDEDENLVHVALPVHAPAFVRTPPPSFAAVPAGRAIRFSVFGDYGVAHIDDPRIAGRVHQVEIAQVLRDYHAEHPLDFGITTGDNFYPTAFATPTDPNWQVTWADLYEPLGIPFYISLGNHDWYEPTGAGPLAEYVYSRTSKSFKLPAFYYTYTAGPAQFFALNTMALTDRQLAWLRDELSKSDAIWKIVYGHYPVYEQTGYSVEPLQEKLLPIFEEFGVDAYFAGHHHTMQHWFIDGTDYVVSGSGGAPNYELGDTTAVAPGRRFVESAPGFAVAELNDSQLTLRFIGREGTVLYEYSRQKPAP